MFGGNQGLPDPAKSKDAPEMGVGPGVCPPRRVPTLGPRRGWLAPRCPQTARGGARGRAGKEPPALGGSAPAPQGARAQKVQRPLPPPKACAERMRRLRVNRACFPFTPSGSVLMKHFLLLALWEYAFLACTARG